MIDCGPSRLGNVLFSVVGVCFLYVVPIRLILVSRALLVNVFLPVNFDAIITKPSFDQTHI
jgi:hypothetical protein